MKTDKRMKLTLRIGIGIAFLATLSASGLQSAGAQTIRFSSNQSKKEVDVAWLINTKEIWNMTPDGFEQKVGVKHFQWQDKARTRARFDPEDFNLQLEELTVGETLVSFKDDKIASVTISILNKGDDNLINKTAYTEAVTKSTVILQAAAGKGIKEEPKPKNDQVTKAKGSFWRSPAAMFLLEHLFLEEQKIEDGGWIFTTAAHAEFVRIRVIPPNKMLGDIASKAKTTVTRPQLQARVKREGKKSVIEGIPMVDQGPKGYCAVASFERVIRYYGADVDMHDLANLANTYGGTNPTEMKDAIYKIAVKLSMSTKEPLFMKGKDYDRLAEAYNRAAKKAGQTEVNGRIGVSGMFESMDAATLKELRSKSAEFQKFKTDVVASINRGIPLLWGLHLGVFWEEKIEQSYEANAYAKTQATKTKEDQQDEKNSKSLAEHKAAEEAELRKKGRPPTYLQGGHMRLIIGYDGAANTLIYTDSWGPGHEAKSMNLEEAFAGTQALMTLEPR